MLSNLEKSQSLSNIQNRVAGKSEGSVGLDRNIFELVSIIGSIGDIVGREYNFKYNNGKIIGFEQMPMRTDKLLSLFREASEFNKRQNKAHKSGRKGPNIPRVRGR